LKFFVPLLAQVARAQNWEKVRKRARGKAKDKENVLKVAFELNFGVDSMSTSSSFSFLFLAAVFWISDITSKDLPSPISSASTPPENN
jgi:hypothetical protein